MNRLLTILVLAALLGGSYYIYTYHRSEVAALWTKYTDGSGAAPQEETAPEKEFVSKIEIPPGPPGEKKLAKPGVFYMLERVSAVTDTGVKAVNPGEEVLLLQRLPNKRMKVAIQTATFEVKETQVTNDLEIAQDAERKHFASRVGAL